MYVHTRNSLTNWKNQKDMIAFSKNTKKKKRGCPATSETCVKYRYPTKFNGWFFTRLFDLLQVAINL